jgi:hypothetical protein
MSRLRPSPSGARPIERGAAKLGGDWGGRMWCAGAALLRKTPIKAMVGLSGLNDMTRVGLEASREESEGI